VLAIPEFLMSILTSAFVLALAQIDEIGLVRVDPNANGSPAAVEIRPLATSGTDLFGDPTKGDPKIGKTVGKKVVRFVFGFDYTGDGVDEIAIASEVTSDSTRPLILKIYNAPKNQNGDLGKPIASLKKGQLKLAGADRVVAMCALKFDADARDELAVVRIPSFGEERLEIFDFPSGTNKVLLPAIASDWTFGPAGEDNFAIASGDADADGKEDVLALRHVAGQQDALSIWKSPTFPISEATLLASDSTIDAADAAPIESAFAVQRNGPVSFQLALLRRGSDGAARLDLHTLPESIGGSLSQPIASEGPLDTVVAANPVRAAFALERDQKLPWEDFEGPLRAYFHVAYPNSEDEIVSSWIGPIPGIVGDGTTTFGLEFETVLPSLGTALATVPNWNVGTNLSIDLGFNTLQLEIANATGIAQPGWRVLFTLTNLTKIEAASATKKRLRYTNPTGVLNGTPCGELQFPDVTDPSGYSAAAAVMEYYFEKP
jgi:hypothetical protein